MKPARHSIRTYNAIGFVLLFSFLALFAGWATILDVSGAVIASGSLVPEQSTKQVQHPTGGVVNEVLVKDGEPVNAGQVLVRLNITSPNPALDEIRAPQAGVTQQIKVRTAGEVVAPGEVLMEIVPRSDQLVFEGKVQPQDIDQVKLGAKVHLRVMAGDQRSTPEVEGVLIHKALALTREQYSNDSYFVVRASLDPDSVSSIGEVKFAEGTPAEAFVLTQDRTLLEYLLKPLSDQIARTFRER
jgi:multidrug efflux pump subunit AcrA (membrane-fusion protein)